MCTKTLLFCSLLGLSPFFCALGEAQESPSPSATPVPVIHLKEDELVLPPYFQRAEGEGAVNVISHEGKKHEAKAGEWLEHGDRFDLSARLSLEVFLSETIQAVGGGVLQLTLSQPLWKMNESPYVLRLNRGWLKVWAKPNVLDRPLRVITPQGEWRVKKGEAWFLVQADRTEIYGIAGEVHGPFPSGAQSFESKPIEVTAKTYQAWDSAGKQIFSRSWDEKAVEVRMGGLYPALVRLAETAQEDWDSGKTRTVYEDLRKKGPRQHTRFQK